MAKGQSFAAAWEGIFASLEYTAVMNQERGTEITIDWENGEESVHSAAEIWNIIFDSNQPWILTANGTILTFEKKGIIPGLLERWYRERKELQAQEERTQKMLKKLHSGTSDNWLKRLTSTVSTGLFLTRAVGSLTNVLDSQQHLLVVQIARHMDAHLNELITGEYDHVGKAVIYGDTDSCYFSAWPVLKKEVEEGRMAWSKETCIQLYDSLAEQVNKVSLASWNRLSIVPETWVN
jgi:hypothetical protein